MHQSFAMVLVTCFAAVLTFSLIWIGCRDLQQGSIKTAVSAFLSFKSTRYFSGLDALRAISVIAVIWTHVSGPHEIQLLTKGQLGVDLFFAISGFLITTLLLREYRHTGRISLRAFYIRRTVRIFPLYYAVLATYCVLVYLTQGESAKAAEFWNNLPAFATYTTNWFVSAVNGADHGVTFYFSWSLATEEQFYLFWPPLLILVLWQSGKNWAPALPIFLLIGFQLAGQTQGGIALLSTIFASFTPAILLGVLFAILLNSQQIFCALWPILGNRLVAPTLFFLLFALMQLDTPRFAINVVMALFVATVCIRENTHLHPFLRWRPLVFVGTISYGIYLMHMLAANLVRKVIGQSFGLDIFVGTTIVTIAAAYLSFRFFESPLMRLARPLSTRSVPTGVSGTNVRQKSA